MLKSSSTLAPFEPKIKPYAHQAEVLAKSWNKSEFGLFMEMGTGKSKVCVDNWCMLFLEREIDGVLIVAPKGGYLNWIDDEIPAHMPEYIPKRVAHYAANWGKINERIGRSLLIPRDDCLDIVCVNIEAMNSDKGFEFARQFTKNHYTMIIVDESTCIKNHSAKRTKAMYKLRDISDYRRILTGTPITDSPLDLYGQCQFLKDGILGFDNWVAFQSHYAVVMQKTAGNRTFEMIVKYKNLEQLTQTIQPFTYRKLKDECLDLPEKIFINHYVDHTPEQAEVYEKMKDEALIMLGKADIVSSTSVITTMMKLHQINCGHVKDDFGNTHDISSNRVSELIDILKSRPKNDKVIIWCNFVRDVELIREAIKKEFGVGQSPAEYYGDTSTEDRRQALLDFKHGTKNYFVSTLATGCRSLTIVESSFTVYYSYDYNLEMWLQSQDRNHRPGQKKKVTYVVMVTLGSVDVRITKALKAKEDLADQVLDNWRLILD